MKTSKESVGLTSIKYDSSREKELIDQFIGEKKKSCFELFVAEKRNERSLQPFVAGPKP